MSWPRLFGGLAGVLVVLTFAASTAIAQDPLGKPAPGAAPAAPAPVTSPQPGPGGPGAAPPSPQPPGPPPTPGMVPAPGAPPAPAAPPTPATPPATPPGAAALHTGTLGAGDKQLETGEYYEDFTLQAKAGDEIIAVLTSLDFDPYLMLIPQRGRRLAPGPSDDEIENDDFGGSPDVSLIEVPVDSAGAYTVRVTSYEPGETGTFVLMASTRVADGNDAGGEDYDMEPEEFTVKGPIQAGAPVAGTIGSDDPTRNDGSYFEAYSFQAQPNTHVVITLTSQDFNAYLTLVSPSGETQENDDQSEGVTDAKIDMTLNEAGQWIVVANTLTEGETGNYRLTVSRP